jgi:hypothetical protein
MFLFVLTIGIAPFPCLADALVAVPFHVDNRSTDPIACNAALAHWYSVEIGRAAPGGAIAVELWSERASGTIYFLNEQGQRMPVELLWCGIAGHDATTRSTVPLERRAGAAEPPIWLVCRNAAQRLDCHPAHAE